MDCSIEGCGRRADVPGTARGFCSGHYHRWQRYGDPLAGGVIRDHDPLSAIARKIEFTDAGCWVWTGAVCPTTGYGTVGTSSAHQRSWELLVGPVPDGLVLDHLCRVRHCVNPDHLEPVTQRENVRRGIAARAMEAIAS